MILNQAFGSDVIRVGSGVSTPALNQSKTGRKLFGMHIFGSAQLEGIARDIFLDGNTFTDSPRIKMENLIFMTGFY